MPGERRLASLSTMMLGLLMAGFPMPSQGQNAGTLPGPGQDAVRPWHAAVTEASSRFALPERWIDAVIGVESGGVPGARSAKGAMGLMQLMPSTWARVSVRQKLGEDPFDLRANVLAGAAYLRAMLDRYGDLPSALAAYNAGPGRVDDWRLNGHALPAETLSYVARLSRRLGFTAPASTEPILPRSSFPPASSWPAAAQPAALRRIDWRAAGLFGPDRNQIENRQEQDAIQAPAVSHRASLQSLGLFIAMSKPSEP